MLAVLLDMVAIKRRVSGLAPPHAARMIGLRVACMSGQSGFFHKQG